MTLPRVILFISENEDSTNLFSEAVGIIDATTVRLKMASFEDAIHYLNRADALRPGIVFFDTRNQSDSAACLEKLRKVEKLNGSAIAAFSNVLSPVDQKSFAAAGVDFYLLTPKTLIHMISVLQHVFTRHRMRTEKRHTTHQLVA